MAKGTTVLFLLAVAVVGQALTPSTFLTTVDRARLKAVFESAQPYTDSASAHYSILGLKLLGATIPKEQEVCKTVTSSVDTNSVASLFHASSAAKALSNCKLSPGGAEKLLSGAITAESSVADIYHAFMGLKNLGLAVDNKKTTTALTEALKKDDTPLSHSYAFRLAAVVGTGVDNYFELIEDIIAQADEVDDQYLQFEGGLFLTAAVVDGAYQLASKLGKAPTINIFEGGLFVTAAVVDGAYQLASKLGKAPTISQDKVLKLANYLMSRKHVQQLKSAYYMLAAVNTLTDNKFHIPVAVTLASSVAVSQSDSLVKVRVTDLMGGSLGKLTVTADSAKNQGDESVVLSKKPFTGGKDSLYELNFMDAKPSRGFYKVTVSAVPAKADARLIGTTGAQVEVKVTSSVSLVNVELGLADKDQSSSPKPIRLQYPKKASEVLEGDFHQKLIMKFNIKDSQSGQYVAAHQTFVKLTNQDTKQEIFFIAEADTGLNNKFDLNIGASAKDFGYRSGRYSMDLIVGDAVIENPLSWSLADVALTFQEGPKTEKRQDQYHKRPEIKHMFREPEKHPSKAVSTAFSVLVLVPILVLFFLWFKIGANVSNFPIGISAIGFHICLGAIFALYYCYWTNLNMFQTLRYLGFIGVPTFIFGNRLLSGKAAKRKSGK